MRRVKQRTASPISFLAGFLCRPVIICLFLVLACLSTPATAIAAEEILSFVSDLTLGRDRVLTVTETITVHAEGRRIRRGIYRDFPLRFRDEKGRLRRVGFEILEIRRNGRPEPWFTREGEAHVRIYIGRKDVLIPPGRHTYTIRYRTWRQIRSFPEHDELYWNVTGNFWDFPIRHARVNVRLPAAAPIRDTALYTGRLGERGRDARILAQRPGYFSAETTRPLRPGEGFTIALAMPKGLLAAEEPRSLRERLADHAFWWLLAGSLGVTGFLLWAWLRVGRDPPAGPVVPRWRPPAGLSPAATAWLKSEATGLPFDVHRALSAALVSLAVKGYVQFDHTPKGTLRILRQRLPDASLPPGERTLMERLLKIPEISLHPVNAEIIGEAISAFRETLKREYRGRFVVRNRLWFLAGLLLAVLVLAGYVFLSGDVVTLFLLLFLGVTGFALLTAILSLRQAWAGLPLWARILLLLLAASFFLPFFLVPVGSLQDSLAAALGGHNVLPAMAALLSLPLAVLVFWFLLPRPTLAGRRALDELEGLELFIRAAESPRLEKLGGSPPRMTVRTFEQLLPYAMALGLEKHWTRAFAAWLASAGGAAATGGTYRPVWFGGGEFSPDALARAGFSPARSISEGIAAAIPSRTSSGIGGGGSSGGGGGGGGGGGW
jgi:hypothetical protein